MNEDRKIKELFGKDNHFEVPAGYFDNLTAQVMDRLPEQEARILSMPKFKPIWQRSAFRKVAAAVAAVIVVSGGAFVGLRNGIGQQQVKVAQHTKVQGSNHGIGSNDDEAFDQMADYTMMDSQDIYASLIAEN